MTDQSNLAAERDDPQAALIAFLSNPVSYPDAVAVKRIETHVAVVFLAGGYAYKLKRAVKLPYLDFSTLEKRRAILEREMEINSRATPELYISIMPVTYRAGGKGFELGGSGEAADWLLVMKRFRQSALLHAMANEGHLSRELVEDLANTVEHFHRRAPIAETAGFGQISQKHSRHARNSLVRAGRAGARLKSAALHAAIAADAPRKKRANQGA